MKNSNITPDTLKTISLYTINGNHLRDIIDCFKSEHITQRYESILRRYNNDTALTLTYFICYLDSSNLQKFVNYINMLRIFDLNSLSSECDLLQYYEVLPHEVQNILLKYGEDLENEVESTDILISDLKVRLSEFNLFFERGANFEPVNLKYSF